MTKLWTGVAVVGALFGFAGAQPGGGTSPEAAAVRAVVESYLAGHATGEGAHFARAMHPEMRMFWSPDGTLQQRTAADYIARAPGTPAADEARRRRWIEWVDVEGTVATAKVVLDHPGIRLTDYLTLLKLESGWVIINKVFHADRSPATP